MNNIRLAIKVDVDTDRGTAIGVPNLLNLFAEHDIQGTFLFSLGPDNTGRAIKRVFRPGFFSKVVRTNVVQTYGLRTLLNGVLLPGPHIARRNAKVMRRARDENHEVGIHCYDHIRWQDGLGHMSEQQVFAEFDKARQEFERVFQEPARTAGAAGWQANAFSLAAYDEAQLLYASDSRGDTPFFPSTDHRVYKTLQIPTTLPTLDELLGLPEYPEPELPDYYLSCLRPEQINVFTVHAEIEGMRKRDLFADFLSKARAAGVRFTRLDQEARALLEKPETIPVSPLVQGYVAGRSGTLAVQGGSTLVSPAQ